MTVVWMNNSVGDEYVAGEEYDLDEATADRFIALGYAVGEYSHKLSDEEIAELQEGNQEVGV